MRVEVLHLQNLKQQLPHFWYNAIVLRKRIQRTGLKLLVWADEESKHYDIVECCYKTFQQSYQKTYLLQMFRNGNVSCGADYFERGLRDGV